MAGRNRTKLQRVSRGRMCEVALPTCPIGPSNDIDIGFSTCEDVTEVGDNLHFFIDRFEYKGGCRINRSRADSPVYYFNEYIPDWCVNSGNFQHLSTSDIPSDASAAVRAIARTNPSRPYVDLPVAIAELADIPALVRDSGRSLLEKVAGANIKYQFGISPTASDIAKLIMFQRAYKIRMEEFMRLHGKRGLRRTVRIGSYSNHDSFAATIQSVGMLLTGRVRRWTRRELKVHARWIAEHVIPEGHKPSDAMMRLVTKTMLGIRNRKLSIDHAASLWEALPWTWLIDWYGDIGTWLNAQRNVIPAKIDSLTVIDHRLTTYEIHGNGVNDQKVLSRGTFIRESKSRRPVIITTPAGSVFPVLSGRQAGILASLSVLRGRRRVF